MVAQVDNLDRHVDAGLRLFQHPLRGNVGETGRTGGTDDQRDFGKGHCRLL